MMPVNKLARMVVANSLRSPRHFILSAFGIVIGIGAFTLFLALTQRAGTVLEKVYPLDEVEVVAPTIAAMGIDARKRLDQSTVDRIKARPEVQSAIPRMNIGFPVAGRGSFEGKDFSLELAGFMDGVSTSYVQDDQRIKELFKDWDSEKNDPNRIACEPPPQPADGDIVESPGFLKKGSTPTPGRYYNPCPTPERYYCDDVDKVCKHRVPVVLSTTVVELYNTRFAKSHGMPAANEDLVKFLIERRGLSAMRFSVGLGRSVLGGGGQKVTTKPPRRVEAVIVGVSSRAMQLGVTVPIEYIERWNHEYMGEETATAYSSIIVKLRDRNAIAPFGQWLKDVEGLRLNDQLGEQFGTVVFVIRILFLIISVAILVVAVINIGHNFFVQVTERRREIGIMRAVGASETDVQLIVLGEAAVIGVVGGLIGVLFAFGIGAAWDAIAMAKVPNFPFKPTSWFDFRPWIWGSALGFSTLFCILGGYLPARRAAKMEPAQALAAQ